MAAFRPQDEEAVTFSEGSPRKLTNPGSWPPPFIPTEHGFTKFLHDSLILARERPGFGCGQPRDLTPGLVAFDNLEWSDDGKQIVYEAQTGQGDWNVYTQLVASGGPILLRTRGRKGLSCALARWKDRGVA